MVQAVIQTVKTDFSGLFGADDMLIETCSSSETEDEEDEIDEERREVIGRMSGFDLITSDKGEKIGVLYLSLNAPLPKEKRVPGFAFLPGRTSISQSLSPFCSRSRNSINEPVPSFSP